MRALQEPSIDVVRRKASGRGFGAPLTAGEVEAFESVGGVRLPDGYRRFLLEIGNGGKGPPAYGLMKLGEVPGDLGRTAEEQLAGLSRPFPLTRYWIWEAEEPLDAPKQALRARVGEGTLVLGHDGCGMFWHLVVTGEERGQIWQVAGEGATHCAPRREFLSWLEYWLDGGEDWWSDLQPGEEACGG